jgi:anaerobic magnesium-protoporphyrin IX monomethyl ester cyclase
MNILVVTTPIRPVPTPYPPLGSLAIIKALRNNGFDNAEFYNIDANRPSFAEAVEHIIARRPRVLGISAVVSTAYAYTKRLSLEIKRRLPDTLIVTGGNLAASAEILLRKTGTDICVIGEGERVFIDICNRARKTTDPTAFTDIAGLVLIDSTGQVVNTGYPERLTKSEIFDVDWQVLEDSSNMRIFFPRLDESVEMAMKFAHDSRAGEPHRRGKSYALIPASKGCVARCTFCHRWDKGIRYVPPDIFIKRIRELVEKYNVGFFSIADENFGTDRRWLADFCAKIKLMDLIWMVSGMRVNCISPEQIEMMKDAGCAGILYGMETGSPRMLEVMEKKTKQSDNENAVRWTHEAGLATIIQLVLGMPGETPETVSETIRFTQMALTQSSDQKSNDLSINYAQALPGTPLYEYGRHKGLIGDSLDSEEAYLLSISDKDAHDEFTTINFTEFPTLEHQSWRPRITIETNFAFVEKYGIKAYHRNLLSDDKYFRTKRSDSGYFANPKRLVDTSLTTDSIHEERKIYDIAPETDAVPGIWKLVCTGYLGLAMICHPVFFYRLRRLLPLLVFAKNLSRAPLGHNLRCLGEYLAYKIRGIFVNRLARQEYKSLRKVVDEELGVLPRDLPVIASLRKGR